MMNLTRLKNNTIKNIMLTLTAYSDMAVKTAPLTQLIFPLARTQMVQTGLDPSG